MIQSRALSGSWDARKSGDSDMPNKDDDARKLIYEKVSSSVLRNRAREMGMRTLREDGIRKVLAGLTTPDEVIRATVGDVE